MRPLWPCLLVLSLLACGSDQDPAPASDAGVRPQPAAPTAVTTSTSPYADFRAAILAGKASQAQILAALDEADIMGLSNTLLHLYAMRDDPYVKDVLQRLWLDPEALQPQVNNPLLSKMAARVALAHTLQRVRPAAAYLDFIRAALQDADFFARSQAVLALGFVGDDSDIPAMQALGRDADPYVAEVAIKALAIRGTPAAGVALLELKRHYATQPHLHTVIRQVLLERFPALSPAASGPQVRIDPDG